jgi:hypothetical protein
MRKYNYSVIYLVRTLCLFGNQVLLQCHSVSKLEYGSAKWRIYYTLTDIYDGLCHAFIYTVQMSCLIQWYTYAGPL